MVLEGPLFGEYFAKVEVSNFEVASDAFQTFKDLLTRHKGLVAAYLQAHYDEVGGSTLPVLAVRAAAGPAAAGPRERQSLSSAYVPAACVQRCCLSGVGAEHASSTVFACQCRCGSCGRLCGMFSAHAADP
jgi:hypothetical protein